MGAKLAVKGAKTASAEEWQYLESRPHRWRKQLYFKDSRLRPFIVWMDMQTNNQTREEAAEDWDLPLEAVDEAISYCERNWELLRAECEAEKQFLIASGVRLEPPPLG